MSLEALIMIIFTCAIIGFVIFINLFAWNDRREMKKERK